MNDLIARSFASTGVPVTKEPSGLFRTDGKRPDGLTLVPWQSGKSMCLDITVICHLAKSYVNGAAIEAGAAAEVAASRKEAKYADIDSRYVFEPIAVDGDSGRFQLLCSSSFKRAWQEDFCQLQRGERGQLFIPAGLGVGAAF